MLTGGTPPTESLMASIVLIPKPGRDPQLVENYRPISLINTDLKLFTKILSLRLDRLLGDLIHPDQVGFIPNRQAFENTRKTADLIWYASTHKIPSLFISLDAEKAFDRAEWPFLFSLLKHLGFPPAYLAAVQALYSSPSAQVVIPGTDMIPFNVRNGTRQGCPLSPALFALFLEPLLQHIRLDPSIRGILIQGSEYKLSAYADDVLLSISQPLSSLPKVLQKLSDFAWLSGYKINMDKSEAIPIHIAEGDTSLIRSYFPVVVSLTSIKYLGIHLSTDPGQLYDVNYAPLLSQIKRDLENWDKYAISWMGRIYCIKMTVLPRLLYFFQALPIAIPPEDLHHLQRANDKFIWRGKRHRIARATLYRPKDAGGLGLPCLLSYYYAAQLAQIVAGHTPPGRHRWVDLERALMFPDDPSLWIWLSKTHRTLLRTNCPAIVNSIWLWDKLAAKCDLASFPSPLSPILRNKAFLPAYSVKAGRGWMDSNISRFYQLYPGGSFLAHTEFSMTGTMALAHLLPYMQLKAFASQPHVKAAALSPLTLFERLCKASSYPKGLISTLYRSLTSLLDWRELTYINAWEKDLGEQLDREEWLDIWDSMRIVLVCTTHQEQLVKTIFRWYVTPVQLSRMSPPTPDTCWKGCGERGSYIHLWWTCPQIQHYWTGVQTLLATVLARHIPMDPWAFLLSRPNPDLSRQEHKLMAKITLAARRLLALEWNCPQVPS
uniref:Reverse transcriptase domain-containing protein n=1 Tax=Leptobrachium leishanense TaxID=445787 RepID=A0A8C5N0D2_9ANUR